MNYMYRPIAYIVHGDVEPMYMVPSFCNSKFLAIILFVMTIACNYFDQFLFCSKLQSTVKIVTFSSVEIPNKSQQEWDISVAVI